MRREFDDYATTERPTCEQCGGSDLYAERPVAYTETWELIDDGNVMTQKKTTASTLEFLTHCPDCKATGIKTGWKIDFEDSDIGTGYRMLVVRLVPQDQVFESKECCRHWG